MAVQDPLFSEIDASTLESVRKNVVFNSLFLDTPFQAKLRVAGVWDEFLGGSGMVEGILYGTTQGGAVNPGQSVTMTRQQINTALKFYPRYYVTYFPMDDVEMDDGSGTGGVINSGEARIVNEYELYLEVMTRTLNTYIEMSSFRHGQANTTSTNANGTVNDNRQKGINGLDEALNNGIDSSLYGNIYKYYGNQVRNGNVGMAINTTPLYLGTSTGGTGQIDFNALIKLKSQCEVTGGKPTLGITNVFGYAAIATALNAQVRYVNDTKHDIEWTGINFDGVDIYKDALAPSAQASNYVSLAPNNGPSGNTSLSDGLGSSTQTIAFQTPQFTNPVTGANVAVSPTGSGLPSSTTIQPSEAIYFLEPESFKIRETNKSGWKHGIRKAPLPNNVSIDAIFMRLSTNLYCCQPRHNAYAFGFSS